MLGHSILRACISLRYCGHALHSSGQFSSHYPAPHLAHTHAQTFVKPQQNYSCKAITTRSTTHGALNISGRLWGLFVLVFRWEQECISPLLTQETSLNGPSRFAVCGSAYSKQVNEQPLLLHKQAYKRDDINKPVNSVDIYLTRVLVQKNFNRKMKNAKVAK